MCQALKLSACSAHPSLNFSVLSDVLHKNLSRHFNIWSLVETWNIIFYILRVAEIEFQDNNRRDLVRESRNVFYLTGERMKWEKSVSLHRKMFRIWICCRGRNFSGCINSGFHLLQCQEDNEGTYVQQQSKVKMIKSEWSIYPSFN